MLPECFFDTYKGYKTDTTRFATWLKETAAARGYKVELANQTMFEQQTKSSRLKGKARKEAKNTQQSVTAGLVKYSLALKDFVPLANFITKLDKPPVEVPSIIQKIGRNAIAARKKCLSWFQKRANIRPTSFLSNTNHAHVINVLEECLEILGPCVLKNDNRKGGIRKSLLPKPNENNKTRNSDNPFNLLDNDAHINDDDNDSRDVLADQREPAEKPVFTQAKAKIMYEMETTDKEFEFAIYCFLEDLNQIRVYLPQMWSEYRDGKIDLMSASMVTNTAFDLAHRAEEDFVIRFPKYSDYEEVVPMLCPVLVIIGGNKYKNDNDFQSRTTERMNTHAYDILHSMYFYPFLRLQELRDGICKTPGVLGPACGYSYNPRNDRSKLSWEEKKNEDFTLLREILPEFFVLSYVEEFPTLDKLARGIYEMLRTKKIKLWLCFALQAFVDIHHTLREDVCRGLQELRVTGKNLSATWLDISQDSECYSTLLNVPDREQCLRMHYEIDQYVHNDVVMSMKEKDFQPEYRKHFETAKPYNLLSQHPLLCGLLILILTLKLQKVSLYAASTLGFIGSAAHLYNALRQEGFSTTLWSDMEYLIDTESPEAFFSEDIPRTAAAYYKNYLLMLDGVFTKLSGKNRRNNRAVQLKDGARGMGEESAFKQLIDDIYVNSIKLMPEHIEALLKDPPRDKGTLLLSASVRHKRRNKTEKPAYSQLLAFFRNSMVAESRRLRFNYYAMHQRCFSLLHHVQSLLSDDIQELYCIKKDKFFLDMPREFVITAMVLAACGDAGSSLRSTFLAWAGQAAQDFLEPTSVGYIQDVTKGPDVDKRTLDHVGYNESDLDETTYKESVETPGNSPTTRWIPTNLKS